MTNGEPTLLAAHTTLRVGGPCRSLWRVEAEADLIAAVRERDARAEPFLILGDGSNVLVADEPFVGDVLLVATRGVTVTREEDAVRVQVAAGEKWDALVARAVLEGWSGVEALAGIPGLVGATPIQNVGAYGQDVSQTVVAVDAYDRAAGARVTLSPEACGFAYRASVMKRSSRYVVLGVTFRFETRADSAPIVYAELARALGVVSGGRAPLARVRDVVLALRAGKGMVLDPGDPDTVSAGSFFMNPLVTPAVADALAVRHSGMPRFVEGDRVKLAAAWLIERSGFRKGESRGAVGLSHKHALAIVNRGGATAAEVLGFAREIAGGVRAAFGVELTPEPELVGLAW